MKKVNWVHIINIGIVLLVVIGFVSGCGLILRKDWNQMVASYNTSADANNFNTPRRLTVVNARTDTVILQVDGTFSISNSRENELAIICATGDGTYQKHYVYLNEWTIYVIEDVSDSGVDLYHTEFTFLPGEEGTG